MTETIDKNAERLAAIAELVRVNAGNQEIPNALADCERALKRAARRAETLSGEWQRVEIPQTRGAILEFTARMVGTVRFETRKRDQERVAVTMAVYETRAGALVAVSATVLLDAADGFEDIRAMVVEPIGDELAMRCAVMDFFGWSDRARSMMRKAGWSYRVEVE